MSKISDVNSSALFIKGSNIPVTKLGRPCADTKPDFHFENQLNAAGYTCIAGVDEVGRGPLAGPVVVAAAIIDSQSVGIGIDDSKRLTAKNRSLAFDKIIRTAHFSVASISAAIIDEINIRNATLIGMDRAIHALEPGPDWSLIDGNTTPTSPANRATAIVKGDQRSISIAAAAIVAKVIRDRMMIAYDRHYPQYGFATNKGYGTKQHMDAISKHGPCPIHRMSFSPCDQFEL